MDGGTRKVYEGLNWRKKVLNRLTISSRIAAGLLIVILITTSDKIVEGLKNNSIVELRHEWIKNKVKDVKNDDFASLDEEDPPRPLIPKTNIHRFKEEFDRKYM